MPRTKANLKAALKRRIAEAAEKRSGKASKPAPLVKRGRLWRTKWLREVRRAQSAAAAGTKQVQKLPFRRLVNEIDAELHGEQHRWSDEAIKALQEEVENRITEMFKVTNALTVTIGKQQTINRPALRLAATMLGMELPKPRPNLNVMRASAVEASAHKAASDAKTPVEASA